MKRIIIIAVAAAILLASCVHLYDDPYYYRVPSRRVVYSSYPSKPLPPPAPRPYPTRPQPPKPDYYPTSSPSIYYNADTGEKVYF